MTGQTDNPTVAVEPMLGSVPMIAGIVGVHPATLRRMLTVWRAEGRINMVARKFQVSAVRRLIAEASVAGDGR